MSWLGMLFLAYGGIWAGLLHSRAPRRVEMSMDSLALLWFFGFTIAFSWMISYRDALDQLATLNQTPLEDTTTLYGRICQPLDMQTLGKSLFCEARHDDLLITSHRKTEKSLVFQASRSLFDTQVEGFH